MPRVERRLVALLALLIAGATAVVLATGGTGASPSAVAGPTAAAWSGLVGSRPTVAVGERVIIVLRTPSLAQQVAGAHGPITISREQEWSGAAQNAQRLLIARLAVEGIGVRPDYSFTRVLDGFSTLLDPNALPVVERDRDVAGVYPVRVAYPTSASTDVLTGHRANLTVSGLDGRGMTIALLDTGVDPTLPYLRGRILPGIDLLGGDAGALAAPDPESPGQLERHGTEMAGLLVGGGGPSGLSGVAPGASVLPIRVAGWQPDALGRLAIYARSDQLIAGLERAVDPNGDGDAHDAARVALVALAEPFAGFDDSPESQAVAGAATLNTLVVAPAGNDGLNPSSYGDIAGPGGAPAALTVGALDTRARVDETRIVVRSGLDTLLDESIALAGAARPAHRLDLEVAAPAAPRLAGFFGRSGVSLVAGRAALVPMGASPAPVAERAAAAGASAVLFYGGRQPLPAGGLGLDESVSVPVVWVSTRIAHAILGRLKAGAATTVTLGDVVSLPNAAGASVAGFSSAGLAFDGSVKPDLVAPGVGLATSDPGANADGSPRFVTVTGSSAAAATVAGAAALVAQARPTLAADALKGVLVGSARTVGSSPVSAQGGGLVAAGAAAAEEIAASPATLTLGSSTGAGWAVNAGFTLTNLSNRRVGVALAVETRDEGAARVDFTLRPRRLSLSPGRSVLVHVRALTASVPVGSATADGAILAEVSGGGELRVPWAIPFAPESVGLIAAATLSDTSFAPSDVTPALLSLDAGRVLIAPGHVQIRPVQRLDVGLSTASGSPLGLLVRLPDLLPGRYTLGITGRGPDGKRLAPGGYMLTLRAFPVGPGPPSVERLRFSVR